MISRKSMYLVLLVPCLLLAIPAASQESEPEMSPEMAAMMEAWQKAMTPGPQHAALAKLVGDWKFTAKMWMEPGAEPTASEGTAVRTMALGGRVLEEKVSSMVMGKPMEGLGRTGYDNVTGTYWSTWTDNMSTGLMVMEGSWDEASGEGELEGEVTDPMTGKPMPVRMTSKRQGEKELSEFFENRGGEWVKTMELIYERQ